MTSYVARNRPGFVEIPGGVAARENAMILRISELDFECTAKMTDYTGHPLIARVRGFFVSRLAVGILCVVIIPDPASAGCSFKNGTWTCSGVLSPQAYDGTALVVENLAADINQGIALQSFGRAADPGSNGGSGGDSASISLDFIGEDYGLSYDGRPVNNFDYVGALAQTSGGAAASGDHDTRFIPGNSGGDVGGVGGNGGNVTSLFRSGTMQLPIGFTDNQVALVGALSYGGPGGAGGDATSPFGGNATGGQGNFGGSGGTATVTMQSGTLSYSGIFGSPAYGLFAASQGLAGGAGGEGKSTGGNTLGGDGSPSGVGRNAKVVIDSGSITFNASQGSAVEALSVGASGGAGSEANSSLGGSSNAGDGAFGALSSTASVVLGNGDIDISVEGGAAAIRAHSQAGDGGEGGYAFTGGGGDSHGGHGGDGNAAGAATLQLGPSNITAKNGASAIFVQSFGGAGGQGGEGRNDFVDLSANGGDGGRGGDSGAVSLTHIEGSGPATISTTSITDIQHAIVLQSLAGAGGAGGKAESRLVGDSNGGDGGAGGSGGLVTANLLANIDTSGPQSQAVFARSYGGAGGDGGSAGTLAGFGQGGSGNGSGPGGDVSVTFDGSILTTNKESNGLLAQSIGGFSGSGGRAVGFVAFGTGSQSAGDGGTVDVNVTPGATVTTTDNYAYGLQAQSIGGGGGRGGSGDGIFALGAGGSAGGDGQSVTVTIGSDARVASQGSNSLGVQAQSVGGGGGDGGGSFGVASLGGSGGLGGKGGSVEITNDGLVDTSSIYATGISASSIGGGGGSAVSSVGIASIGGSGGKGNTSGTVTINNSGRVVTQGPYADAIIAQSIGGGGGNGASAYGVAPGVSLAIGGTGGSGGDSNTVTFNDTGSAGLRVSTLDEMSRGVFLQSIGGGGGDGGNAISVSGLTPVSVALGFSGSGGGGGDGGNAQYQTGKAAISTAGDHSAAIHVQSVGGGGGNAGTVVAGVGASGIQLNYAVGGSGGGGGSSALAFVQSTGALSTSGWHSPALFAQSIGGGGGNAGTSVSGSGTAAASMSITIGGAGGTGGDSAAANAFGGGGVTTTGDNSPALHLQSIGGGGGNGGATVAASGITLGSANISLGGNGGKGGKAGTVHAIWSDGITTSGENAAGVFAQSVGGGGGHSGTTVAGAASSDYSLQTSVGGAGGSGGRSDQVTVTTTGKIATSGKVASGVRAQSIGGGGGHSGTTVSATAISTGAINASIGGSGGAGGNGMGVTVDVADISTKGHSSSAVSAMSIGGGGGSSDFTGAFTLESQASLDASIGGSGGSAGDGGAVSVEVSGALDTAGHNAAGVKAMSIGGGGGDSGMTMSGSLFSNVPLGVSVGGDGGNAGSGGMVGVTTAKGSTIKTTGDVSEGILAASIARGGGSSGTVMAGSVLSDGKLGIAIGGKGGKGGGSNTVNVTSYSKITTDGVFSSAIEARSVAGSGGSAKGSINISALSMGDASLTLGGDGGDGGTAGAVSVRSSGAGVTTTNHNSPFILAQSIGGAGGNGGLAAQASMTGGKVSGEVGVTIGGKGGTGGAAGTVLVDADNTAATSDFGSVGIVAQSIGGAGGTGGSVYTGNLSFSTKGSANINVDIGGTGGSGAVGSTVTVNNSGSLSTDGFLADGIVAQSIGGSGGSGGSVYSVLATVDKGSSAKITVNVGGSGGTGQHAGDVGVKNLKGSAITVGKGGSSAIVAMSVGGGGGRGGAASSINLEPLPSLGTSGGSTSFGATVDIGVGGKGGAGGDGGKVTATNEGSLTTSGQSSKGVYAISVGGGGGSGGTATSASFSFDGTCSALTSGGAYDCKAPGSEDTSVSVSLTADVGGNGAGAGDGDTVTVANTGSITTNDRLGHGIVAHSIGGGGGDGVEGSLGLGAWTNNVTANSLANLTSNFTFIPKFSEVSMAIGGSAGASGTGGAISAGGTGTIVTKGDHAFGIHAQSIGGGGGSGGAGSTGLWSNATVGGRGSGGGDGGAVTVNQGGAIGTSGEGGVAIFAQSVGGGGGTAGDIERGFTDPWLDLNIGAGPVNQQQPGSGGDGGAISVTTGPIVTTGPRAHGIVAQSVGGSGGIAAVSGTVGAKGPTSFAGGVHDAGNGGQINITTNGKISTSGESAHGIFVQSTTGRLGSGDTSGDVTIDVNADLAATGKGGRAILAQSEGDTTGAIAIDVAVGATVSTAADGFETIGLFQGTGNSITNGGTIRHAGNGAGDYVIRTNGSGLTVQNNGIIEGSVLTRGSLPNGPPGAAISIANASGSVFGLGPVVNLGNGGSLTNAGTVSAGSVGTIGTSTFTGAFTQKTGGVMLVDYGIGTTHDIISFPAARPNLAGTVDPMAQGTPPSSGATGSFTFLSSPTGIGTNTLTVANTATVDYSLSAQSGTIGLSYSVDYAPWEGDAAARSKVPASTRKAVTGNHTRFARHLDELVSLRIGALTAGSNNYAFVDDLAFFLLEVPQVADLVEIYDRFTPTEVFAPGETALFSTLRFGDDLMSCPAHNADGTFVFTQEGSCVWGRAAGVATRNGDDSFSAYDENVLAFSAGLQTEISPDLFAGFAVGYERSSLSGDGVSGDGNRYNVGAVLKQEIGPTTISGSIIAGMSDFDLDRQVMTPNGQKRASGDPRTTWVAAHARIAHAFDLNETTYLKPWLDVGVQRIWQDSYSETGAGDFGLDVGSMYNTVFTLNPMLEWGKTFDSAGVSSELKLSGGALFLLGDTGQSASVRLLGLNGTGPSYTISNDAHTTFANFDAEYRAQVSGRATITASFGALLSSDQQIYTGGITLDIAF